MLSTLFTSLVVAVQTTDFIDLLKDAFRPLFNLEPPDSSDGSSSSARFNRLPGAYAIGGGAGTYHLRC